MEAGANSTMVRAGNAVAAPLWRSPSTAPWPELPGRTGPGEAPRPVRRYKIRRRLKLRPEARLVGTVGLLFALAVLVISRYAVLYGMNQAILQRQQEIASLERANQHLAIEVAGRDSLGRLEAAARARGYQEPASVRAVRVPAAADRLAAAPAASGASPAVREAVVALAPAGAGGPAPAPAAAPYAAAGGPAARGPAAWLAGLWHRVFGS
ncbi:hypothetical protein Tmar_0863 [Thermaerobacter marianensis DSM 12885]|uniref:Cell division protein FtsL n=2 Tax=Thermaerobacter marianensis TaxID=73919 RepID=E6SIY2_THEM7|nr:hypothetical protein Tmar_0863 [Thermaerobacter marianensis DSM 12885]